VAVFFFIVLENSEDHMIPEYEDRERELKGKSGYTDNTSFVLKQGDGTTFIGSTEKDPSSDGEYLLIVRTWELKTYLAIFFRLCPKEKYKQTNECAVCSTKYGVFKKGHNW
jgi:hypothetical protein